MASRRSFRLPILGAGIASLFLGLWAGLFRIGEPVAPIFSALPEAHGILMVNGVLATLIGLERAIGLEVPAFLSGPGLTGLGAILLAIGVAPFWGWLAIVAGSGVILAEFLELLRRSPAVFTVGQSVGAAVLLFGNTLAATGREIPYLVPWWLAFLVLVIAAERLELTRVLPLSRASRWSFGGSMGVLVAGVGVSLANFAIGFEIEAVGIGLTALWLLLHDIARRNLVRGGSARFAASTLIGGYVWLGIGGGLILVEGAPDFGLGYDAALHAVFLGFVLSMIFAHSLTIFPPILGRPVRFHPALYLPVLVLDLSLAGRIVADLIGSSYWRAEFGIGNVAAIVLFGAVFLARTAMASPPTPARSVEEKSLG